MPKPIDHLMQQDMNRKEFLATLAFGMASIMGFSTIIHMLTGKSLTHRGVSKDSSYGSSAYGGSKNA